MKTPKHIKRYCIESAKGFRLADIDPADTGGLDIDVGGAHAVTEGIAYRNPFGDIPPFTPALGGTITDISPAQTQTIAPPPPAPPATTPGTTVMTPATAGRSFSSCLSSHAFGGPACGRDLARVAAGVGLAVALLLFVADAVLVLRRRGAPAP